MKPRRGRLPVYARFRVFLSIACFPLLARAQISAARQFELSGDLPAAEQAYEAELKLRPAAATWLRLGLVRHLQNKFEPAIPALREALRLDPSLWNAHLFLGICLYRTNRFEPAAAELAAASRQAPAEGPGRDEIDYWLGASRIAARKPLSGLQSIEKLLARNPRHTAALELAARAYADLGSAIWNDVAERFFESPAGYEVHGHALESDGNLAGAIEAYRRSVALKPGRPGPRLEIGRLLLRQGAADEALAELRRELDLSPGDPEASYQAGLALSQLGRYGEAAPLLEAAGRWAGGNAEPLLALAQVHLALGNPARAAEAARKAVGIAPESEAAHELLVTALRESGFEESAEEEKSRWRRRAGK
jgi:tetratricopeptide (TPR) repeat protein